MKTNSSVITVGVLLAVISALLFAGTVSQQAQGRIQQLSSPLLVSRPRVLEENYAEIIPQTPSVMMDPVIGVGAPSLGPYHWPRGSRVQVYFMRTYKDEKTLLQVSAFTPEQHAGIVQAMETWNELLDGIVIFKDAGQVDRGVDCTPCITIVRIDIKKWEHNKGQKHYAFFKGIWSPPNRLFRGTIYFDVRTTKPAGLEQFMLHELAHGLGLWDCIKCKSLMGQFGGGINPDKCDQPRPIDIQMIRDLYDPSPLLSR